MQQALHLKSAGDPKTGLKHIPSLDGVRGIAILMVLVHHFGQVSHLSTLQNAVKGLWIGVDLFFVLSGFLITGILLDAKGAPHYFRNFYARRTLRIFPLYYAVIVASLVSACFIPAARGIWRSQGWLWLYGTNIKIALAGDWFFQFGPVDLNHYWSLAVEEHFYLVWPAVVLILNRRLLVGACGLLILGALGCRLYLMRHDHYLASYVLTPCRVDLLASGGLVAVLMRSERGRAFLRKCMPVVLPAGLTLATYLNYRGKGLDLPFMRIGVVYYDALAGIFAWLVWYAATHPTSRTLSLRPLIALGRWSYGIYVYHVIVRGVLPTDMHPLAYIATGISLSVLVAAASWRFFELPVNNLKRYFPRAG